MYELLKKSAALAGLLDTDLEHVRRWAGKCGYLQGRSRLQRIVPASGRFSFKEERGQ